MDSVALCILCSGVSTVLCLCCSLVKSSSLPCIFCSGVIVSTKLHGLCSGPRSSPGLFSEGRASTALRILCSTDWNSSFRVRIFS